MRKLLFLLFLLIFSVSFSKTNTLTSDKISVEPIKNETAEIDRINNKNDESYKTENYKGIISSSKKVIQLATKIKYKKGLGKAYSILGMTYAKFGKNKLAFDCFEKSVEIAKQINDKKSVAETLLNIGSVFESQDNYKMALSYFIKSLKICEEIQDLNGIANAYNLIGIIYYDENNDEKAAEYYHKALRIKKKIKDMLGVSSILHNIGILYLSNNKIDSAIQLTQSSIKIMLDNHLTQGLSTSYINLGTCYRKLNQYVPAIVYHKKALKINMQSNDTKGIALAALCVGKDFLFLDKKDSALFYAKLSIKNSQIGNNLYLKRNAYLLFGEIYEKQQNFKASLKFQKLIFQLNDSIYNQETQHAIADMIAKYDTEKKENQIKLLSKENELKSLQIREQQNKLKNHRTIVFGLIIFTLLIVSLSWLLLSRNRLKQEELRKTELLKQQEVHTKAIIEAQEKERKRIAQDLHDGIGQNIVSIKLNLSNYIDKTKFDSVENQSKMKLTLKSLDEVYEEVRSLSHQMMPKSLLEISLSSAFSDLLLKTFSNSTIQYSFENDSTVRLNQTTEIGLYRIFQELLNNVIKHSNASEIAVHLHQTPTHTILIVEDNGTGIEQKKNYKEIKGIGLSNIEARVNSLKGTFSLTSATPKGAIAMVRIPIS